MKFGLRRPSLTRMLSALVRQELCSAVPGAQGPERIRLGDDSQVGAL